MDTSQAVLCHSEGYQCTCVFEDPEPNGEVEQDLMMELDYRTLHENVEMCVCLCMYINVCLCVYLHTVIFLVHTITI